MDDYDLTGKFGWYLALGSLVLLTVIGKWFELRKPKTCEPDPSLSFKPMLSKSMSQVETELASIRGEMARISAELERQQITMNAMGERVERIDHRLVIAQER
jgi:hypothetical protein